MTLLKVYMQIKEILLMNKNKIPNFGVFLITDYMEVIMELRERVNKIISFGIPISVIAKKVNKDHSTIGLVVTTDGSVTDIDRESYEVAEERVINELKEINKPFVIMLNSVHPKSEDTIQLARSLEEKYDAPVISTDVLNLTEKDVTDVFERVLEEFPVSEIGFILPPWFSMLDLNNWLKQALIGFARGSFEEDFSLRSINKKIDELKIDNEYIKNMTVDSTLLSEGKVKINVDINNNYFYILSPENEKSILFLKEVGFAKIHVFPYSKRSFTPAAKLKQVPDKIKSSRVHDILELSTNLEKKFVKKFLDKKVDVLFEKHENNINIGHASEYFMVYLKSDIDYTNTIQSVQIVEIFLEKCFSKIFS